MAVKPPHLMTLADLSTQQIYRILCHSQHLKMKSKAAISHSISKMAKAEHPPVKSLNRMSIALLFSKRSTRTRVSAETAAGLLGGQALFLGKDDIQLGVNESARDTAQVLSRMVQGIFARVGEHEEIEVRFNSCRAYSQLIRLYTGTRPIFESACTKRPFFALAPHTDPRRLFDFTRTQTTSSPRAGQWLEA